MDESNIGGYVISGLLLAGFVYFIYTRWQASKNKPRGSGSGGGGTRPGGPPKQRN